MPPDTALRKRRKEARPSELAAAALELFVEKGFAATRLEDIAARAGVSKGTLYLYFDSKDALFKAVIREGIMPIMDEAESRVASYRGGSFELLVAILRGCWENLGGAARLSGIPKLIVSESRNFPEVARFYYENVIQRGRALIGNALERGMNSGEFRRLEVEPCIDVALGPLFSLAIWQHSIIHCEIRRKRDPEAILRTHLEVLREGLMAR
ncbi:MAG: TetR/AcrR family transcriptional regulator [Betaproteobacteria bacterium]